MVYRIADGVKITPIENGASIERSGDKYTVSGSGTVFLELIDGKRDMDEILEELIKIFGPNVEPYNLARDLERFMHELAEEGLIVLVKSIF